MQEMKNIIIDDKYEMLKETIEFLYSKEGRSKVYISKLLKLNRKKLTEKIKLWNLKDPEPKRRLTPSSQKFLNKNKDYILSRLKTDITLSDLAKELGIGRKSLLNTYIFYDEDLKKAYDLWKEKKAEKHEQLIEFAISNSSRNYEFEDLENEVWKDIKNFDGYQISNYGRVKHYSVRYKRYYLLKPIPNKNNDRLYIALVNNKGKTKNLQVARLVGLYFVEGRTKEKDTINHYDGDVQNNHWTNLFWESQFDNNRHSCRVLGRKVNNERRFIFSRLIYKDKYEFKTIASLSRFIGKSETQVRRYLEEPEKHDIKIIK